MGLKVEKVAAVPASGSSVDLFSVDGGPVTLLGFMGIVETVLPANTDLSLHFDPDDGGANSDLATTLICDSDPTGTIYALNPTAAGALVALTDVGYGGMIAIPITIADSGDILLTSAGGGAGGGSIRWYCIYLPVEAGATITAA
jgi:hypothetical protein